MDPASEVKVIRAPSLRRGKPDERLSDRIKLKKVIGLTVSSNAGLDVSNTLGILAYPAGCTVVLFNSRKLSQHYLQNNSRKAITAVAFSHCGRYLATGECGISPTIKVWELEITASHNGSGLDSYTGGQIVAEFPGHKYAVSCVAFSPTGKYLVSVGSQHDNIVNVFDWKSNLKIASNKVSSKVVAVSFCEDGSYFVTVGNRHVKYWYLEGSRKYKEPIPLMGRSAILGELRNNDFSAVACGKGEQAESTYAITKNGHLVEFNARRLLEKWVMCRTASATCIVVSVKYIFVGCGESIIRCFNAATLEYVTTLPRTHFLGVDVALGVQISHMMTAPENAKYPDTIAIVYDEARSKISCIYNDHSLYIWDLRDIRRVGKSHSFLYHSACIWGVETVPLNYAKSNIPMNLPLDCFLTCSSDDTIRVWGLDDCENNEFYRKNIYSKELLKIFYIDNDLNFIKDMDNPTLSTEKSSSSYDGRNGVRCIKINSINSHLATGDRSGNIRIYNLNNLKLLTTIEAHDSEVLCLEYTNEKIKRRLLASASRDRLIHIFNVEAEYQILQTLDDHSSSITSVKFVGSGMEFSMISCGADKSIIFRPFQHNYFNRGNNSAGKATLYDMEVDSNSKHILTACQDRSIRVYSTQTTKHTKTFKGSHSEDGSLIKLCLDASGIYIATSCTDKTLSVYDYYSSECMARMSGHSELVTGLKFTNDCKHLISASGDGCVFVWQVPHDMVVTMQARLSQQAIRLGQAVPRALAFDPATGSPPSGVSFLDEVASSYRFSEVGQLPQWAKRRNPPHLMEVERSQSPVLGSSPATGQKPRGRWAQRSNFDAETDLRSVVESPSAYSERFGSGPGVAGIANNTPTSGYNSASSKDIYNAYLSEDSSIDSGRENRKDRKFGAPVERPVEQNNMSSFNSESTTEHDGDIEDISDGERTNSDQGLLYYPTPGTPTDFKVNEMDANELRKSLRKQKLEKQGLTLSTLSLATTTGGTGTSDDEDDVSTPSGDNAERSLISNFGGSTDQIPQENAFLQAAMDGPGRGLSEGRKSFSAIHNTEGKISTSISKSFANSKKEELMKVINEAKQKLENVGYRSNLRASQSISDLSHSKGYSRTGQRSGTDTCTDNLPDSSAPVTNYMNSAASRSTIAHNLNVIRQFQCALPPYPTSIGCYNKSQKSLPHIELPVEKLRKHPSILKHYKSCPVSPVNEEMEWSSLAQMSSEQSKRFSYGDDVKSILNMIHVDTEKMIAEITKKYGDLEEIVPKLPKRILNMPQKDEEGFSSDSLEDCSLNEDLRQRCRKHAKAPRRAKSDYQIREEHPYRNVSLSDILDEADRSERQFYSSHRHSSASFFLQGSTTKPGKSQESLLSDELDAGSYYNSMESILSDESDCKSAPLEVLFARHKATNNLINEFRMAETQASKSYGSSPNTGSFFDYYMCNQGELEATISSYGFETLESAMPSSRTCPSFREEPDSEFIPTLTSKAAQYTGSGIKSLTKDFAQQRKTSNTNPLYGCDKSFSRADVFGSSTAIKKSSSLNFGQSRFKQNLQKFENERLAEYYRKSSTLETDYIAHKPPPANRKSSSIRRHRKSFVKESFVVIGHVNPEQAEEIKSFELYVAERESAENMDSLENLHKQQQLKKANSVDSLDPPERDDAPKVRFTDSPEYVKFKDIEKKIDVINKLVELEEKKLERERTLKELRMTPFQCDSTRKGYVRSLSKNFDRLSHAPEPDFHHGVSQMKRNASLPDVLEGAKFSIYNIDRRQMDNALHHFLSSNESDDSSIRRACSLTDLSIGIGKGPKLKGPVAARSPAGRSLPKRSNSTVTKSSASGMGLRSVSTGVLNQASDSEPESVQNRGGVMRPTISSQNKQAGQQKYVNPRSAAGIISRRKGLQSSYSNVNIASAAQEDSSSEESSSPRTDSTVAAATNSNSKPSVPPRPRNFPLGDNKRVITITNTKGKTVDANDMLLDNDQRDPENAVFNSQMCSNLIHQLMHTASSVMQLHQKLKNTEEGSSNNNNIMLKELENAVIMTQTMLTKITNRNSGEVQSSYTSYITNSHDRATINITPTNNLNNNSSSGSSNNNSLSSISGSVSAAPTPVTSNHPVNKSSAVSNGDFNQLMTKCSDLLSKVQKHVKNA